MNVKPFGVRQSDSDASEHVAHLVREKSTQSKLERVFKPLPKGTPPLVAVRKGWVSYAYSVAW